MSASTSSHPSPPGQGRRSKARARRELTIAPPLPPRPSSHRGPALKGSMTTDQALLSLLSRPTINDPHSGSWQKQISPFLSSVAADQGLTRAGQAYLNPGHQSNAFDAVPLPDGTPGRVFLFKSTWNEEIILTTQSAVIFYNLPFFEAPFGHWDQETARLRCFTSPNCVGPGGPNPAAFFHNHNVYRYRCLGKSMTIVNTTAIVNRRGSCTVARKTPDVDYTTRQFTVGGVTDGVNQPILQNLPVSMHEVSSLQGTTETWDASDGAYLVSHHADHQWVTREDPTQKAYPVATFLATNANTGLLVKTSTATTAAAPSSATSSTINVGPQDHTDIPMACFAGLLGVSSSFNVKCVLVYELVLKLDSDLIPYTVERPLMSSTFMDALFAYEATITAGGMKADANAWSDIWKGFKGFWNKGGNALTKAGLNAIIPGAGNIGSMLGDFATSKY